jgi:hypothetical protein
MNRKQKSLVVVVFMLTLVVGLITELPVTQVFRVIQPPPGLDIRDLQGSITGGSIGSIGYQGYSLDDISYSLSLSCLIKASICYQLESPSQPLKLNIGQNLITRNIAIFDSYIQLGSDMVDAIPGLLVKPKGIFELNVEQITLVDLKVSDLQAKIDWKEAGIEGEEQVLGNYSAVISRQKGLVNIQLSDSDSLLSLSGEANLRLNGQYDTDIQLASKPGLNPSINSALDMAAKRTGLNRFSIKQKGSVPSNMIQFLQYFQPQG